jgi:hypothetical protein
VARLEQLRAQCANARGVDAVVIGEQDLEWSGAAERLLPGRWFDRGVRGTDARDRERRCESRARDALQSSISAW